MLDVKKEDLLKDFKRAKTLEDSYLFKKIYEEEFGTYGGIPYTCLLGDFDFSRSEDDLILLDHLSKVAACAHTPFLSAASPALFDLDSVEKLGDLKNINKVMSNQEMAQWKALRKSEDSRYLALTLPKFLIRSPYNITNVTSQFYFEEDLTGVPYEHYCWANSAYALATQICMAHKQYGWTSAIRGVEGGGLLTNLPLFRYYSDLGDQTLQCPTQIQLSDRQEKVLSDEGFIPLCHCKGESHAAFFSAQTVQKPTVYKDELATKNAYLSQSLPYIMAASRFSHYLKVMMRDKIGSFSHKEQLEKYLNNWLADYILLNDKATQELKAKYPLREGRVDVEEDASIPGKYRAVIYLKPHFQLEELDLSIRLVAQLPERAFQGTIED